MPWEWLVLLLVAVAAAAYIALPRRAPADAPDNEAEQLRAERTTLLALLREFDDDAAAGRISAQDRAAGRRELAPRLRAVTERLAALGEPRDVDPPATTEDRT
jgi:hypothetical protein